MRTGDRYYSTPPYTPVDRYYSIHEWVKFPTFDTPGDPKTALALAPGPFFDVLVRWVTLFLFAVEHFLIPFDRDLIPPEAG